MVKYTDNTFHYNILFSVNADNVRALKEILFAITDMKASNMTKIFLDFSV